MELLLLYVICAVNSMSNIYQFEGKPSGDGECFCFEVDVETYKAICGLEDYYSTKSYREVWAEENGTPYPDEPWRIYPGKLFGNKWKKLRITITYEEVE